MWVTALLLQFCNNDFMLSDLLQVVEIDMNRKSKSRVNLDNGFMVKVKTEIT